jgi:O-acetyl-ADP-ribose deacetylase (regulator of RNase III)
MIAPRIAVVQGSLTDGHETVLVNASNTNVALGSGVSAAIRSACGPGYQEHIQEAMLDRFHGPMAPGDVLITDAGTHPTAKWVAHVAVMDYRDGFTGSSRPTPGVIEDGCNKLWPAVEAIGEDVTVAMVALGAGVGQLGVRVPTQIACDTLKRHLDDRPSRIKGVTFYGFMLHEKMAIAEVVKTSFPEATA